MIKRVTVSFIDQNQFLAKKEFHNAIEKVDTIAGDWLDEILCNSNDLEATKLDCNKSIVVYIMFHYNSTLSALYTVSKICIMSFQTNLQSNSSSKNGNLRPQTIYLNIYLQYCADIFSIHNMTSYSLISVPFS